MKRDLTTIWGKNILILLSGFALPFFLSIIDELEEKLLVEATPGTDRDFISFPSVSLHARFSSAVDGVDRSICDVCRMGILNVFASEARTGDNCPFILSTVGKGLLKN